MTSKVNLNLGNIFKPVSYEHDQPSASNQWTTLYGFDEA